MHLRRTDENVDEIDGARPTGSAAGPALDGVLADLNRQARRTFAARPWRRAPRSTGASRGTTRTARDQRWWPQGISTSADASDTEDIERPAVLVVTLVRQGRRAAVTR